MLPDTDLSALVGSPVHIHLVAEMGAGKSTFLDLLVSYEQWLNDSIGGNKRFVYPFIEHIPGKEMWSRYQDALRSKARDPVIFDVQSFFMEQKISHVYEAAGIEYLTNDTIPRKPGLYLVERDPREDLYVFANMLQDQFPESGYKSYDSYIETYKEAVDNSPRPDLVIRLTVPPHISERRVNHRGYGEKLGYWDYKRMAALYTLEIDEWLRDENVPTIEIDTEPEKFDFTTRHGQNYFLTELLSELHDKGYWNTDEIALPMKPLLPLP